MSENGRKEHPFDRLMFGNKSSSSPSSFLSPKRKESSSSEEFDFIGMLQNIDHIMGSIDKVKPFVKNFSPLLDMFKSKK